MWQLVLFEKDCSRASLLWLYQIHVLSRLTLPPPPTATASAEHNHPAHKLWNLPNLCSIILIRTCKMSCNNNIDLKKSKKKKEKLKVKIWKAHQKPNIKRFKRMCICILCVCVIINKRSSEPFCVWILFQNSSSHLFQSFACQKHSQQTAMHVVRLFGRRIEQCLREHQHWSPCKAKGVCSGVTWNAGDWRYSSGKNR